MELNANDLPPSRPVVKSMKKQLEEKNIKTFVDRYHV